MNSALIIELATLRASNDVLIAASSASAGEIASVTKGRLLTKNHGDLEVQYLAEALTQLILTEVALKS